MLFLLSCRVTQRENAGRRPNLISWKIKHLCLCSERVMWAARDSVARVTRAQSGSLREKNGVQANDLNPNGAQLWIVSLPSCYGVRHCGGGGGTKILRLLGCRDNGYLKRKDRRRRHRRLKAAWHK